MKKYIEKSYSQVKKYDITLHDKAAELLTKNPPFQFDKEFFQQTYVKSYF